jgi:hypothetical protein
MRTSIRSVIEAGSVRRGACDSPCLYMPLSLLATLALVLFSFAPSAQAAFTRPFVGQIAGTPTGIGHTEMPFGGVDTGKEGGIGPVAADSEDVWVVSGISRVESIDEFRRPGLLTEPFDPAGAFVEPPLELKPEQVSPVALAADNATGDLYVAGTGVDGLLQVEVLDSTGVPVPTSFPSLPSGANAETGPDGVAVDNSTDSLDLSSGDVYVANNLQGGGISKFSATGVPLEFSALHEPEISGSFSSVAVDGEGDIYAITGFSVEEYSPEGVLLHVIDGQGTPGLTGLHVDGGWGAAPHYLAFDPKADHVLVSLFNDAPDHGVIDEFDAAGGFVSQITQVPRPSTLPTSCGVARASFLRQPSAMAVDPEGALYVADPIDGRGETEACENAVDVYASGLFVPSVTVAEAGERTGSSVVLDGSVNPEEQSLSACGFEYVSETAFQATGFEDLSSGGVAPCVPGVSQITGGVPVAVHGEATGLTAGVAYRYRLSATSSGGVGGTSVTEALAFTPPAPPRVESVSATNLSSTFVELHARIDPAGADTTYHFEYSADGASWVSAPGGGIGTGGLTGSAVSSVVAQVGGLVPATSYRFRLVAENAAGVSGGGTSEGMFATLAAVAVGLPDGRAYELVTPPVKGSSPDMFGERSDEKNEFNNPDRGYAAETGAGFLLTSTLAAFGPDAASENNAYLFSRTADGWQTTSLAVPSLGLQDLKGDVFDPLDFSAVAANDYVGSPSSAAGYRLTSLFGPAGGPYTTLHADLPVHDEPSEEVEHTEVVGGSRDLSTVILESKSHALAPGATRQDKGSEALYQYSAGEATLVDLNLEDEAFKCGAVLGESQVAGARYNAVSTDGSEVIFTAPDPYAKNDGAGCWNGGAENTPQLYARFGGKTVEISAPEAGAPKGTGTHYAVYVGASEDGSRVFFVTETELTKDDTGIHDPELYEWRPEGTGECVKANGCLTRVSHGESGVAAGDVADVPEVSADGSAVYFMASGILASNAGSDGTPASAGECQNGGACNLYRYDTVTGTMTYITAVEGHDYHSGALNNWIAGLSLSPSLEWYTTPDGRYLMFSTTREITPYRTVEAAPGDCPSTSSGAAPNGRCSEVYRYDGEGNGGAGELVCLSCNPSGAAPVSNAEFANNAGSEQDPAAGSVRAISNDGAYAFFATADALVPQDTNGTQDVYEWHAGTLSLISSGEDPAPSFFLGMSGDGSNVFFGTHARLVPQDMDNSGDIYDARICTVAEPCIAPPPGETAQCEGDACQNSLAAPFDATPGSLTFSGAGNLVPAITPVALTKKAAPKKTAAEIKAEKLAKALKACRKKPKRKRAACEAQARKKYAPAKKRGKR